MSCAQRVIQIQQLGSTRNANSYTENKTNVTTAETQYNFWHPFLKQIPLKINLLF